MPCVLATVVLAVRSPGAIALIGAIGSVVDHALRVGDRSLAVRSPGAIALIGALAGIAGAVVGGAAGGFATYKIEQQRQHFERDRDAGRETAIQRGVVRVWADQLGNYAAMMMSVPGRML
jgi:hypothetical protein